MSSNNSLEITFIGEVMLGREVAEKLETATVPIVQKEIKSLVSKSDFVLANLEAPVAGNIKEEDDIMTFIAKPEALKEVDFIDGFSLANNHINDAGTLGIEESIVHLEERNFKWNGFYKKNYEPIILEKKGIKCAIICCTDVLNEEIDYTGFDRKLLWLDDEVVDKTIQEYKKQGFYVILYVHGGIMFSRYPNPAFRNVLHEKIDIGSDLVVTVHPHVLGCEETYKGKKIFYSLGDFIMDGHSERRRNSAILKIKISEDYSIESNISLTYIDHDLKTVLSKNKRKEKQLKSWYSVSKNLEKYNNSYNSFYKKAFKKEIFAHVTSTLQYQIKSKGVSGLIKIFFNRAKDFKNMGRWFFKDTSKMRNNLEDKSML